MLEQVPTNYNNPKPNTVGFVMNLKGEGNAQPPKIAIPKLEPRDPLNLLFIRSFQPKSSNWAISPYLSFKTKKIGVQALLKLVY